MGDESGDETAIKLPVRNERQCRRLLVLGFLSEPAHSGMQPALPIPVETFAPPLFVKCLVRRELIQKLSFSFIMMLLSHKTVN